MSLLAKEDEKKNTENGSAPAKQDEPVEKLVVEQQPSKSTIPSMESRDSARSRGRGGGPQRGGRREFKKFSRRDEEAEWFPKTRLGKMVANGEITSMSAALATGLRIREAQIVDTLLPELEDQVLDVNMVQRMTDSGRRVTFAITTVVGNGDGYIGIGRVKGKEVGPSIRKGIDIAKTNIIEIRRGCGSWDCGCGKPQSLPFAVQGKMGSVNTSFKPAPQGISLAMGDVAKQIFRLAGVDDAWGFTKGHTKTTVNFALSTYEALKSTTEFRVTDEQEKRLHIITGSAGEMQ